MDSLRPSHRLARGTGTFAVSLLLAATWLVLFGPGVSRARAGIICDTVNAAANNLCRQVGEALPKDRPRPVETVTQTRPRIHPSPTPSADPTSPPSAHATDGAADQAQGDGSASGGSASTKGAAKEISTELVASKASSPSDRDDLLGGIGRAIRRMTELLKPFALPLSLSVMALLLLVAASRGPGRLDKLEQYGDGAIYRI